MLYNEYLEEDILDNDISQTVTTKKSIVSFKTVVFVALSLILSMQTLTGGLSPFGYVMMGLASVFNVPLLAVFLSSAVGMLISSFSMSQVFRIWKAFYP
jgi:hypothetical protein